MKIKNSRNLKHDKIPWALLDGYERFNPKVCFLESFDRIDDKLVLCFNNKSHVTIIAVNFEGGKEIDLIEKRLNNFAGRTYEEILEIEINE